MILDSFQIKYQPLQKIDKMSCIGPVFLPVTGSSFGQSFFMGINSMELVPIIDPTMCVSTYQCEENLGSVKQLPISTKSVKTYVNTPKDQEQFP